MQSQRLDIVELIEQNPITKLSQNYQGKFIQKIQEHFNQTQHKLFIASFYCYLNYDSKTDFVIDFDSIWKWLGFGRKEECKRVLTKHFTQDTDYKIATNEFDKKPAPQVGGAAIFTKNLGGAGKNKEKILMTINTFKKLCLKSNTKKADEIHDYFIMLEELTQEIINEESIELKLQLENHQLILLEQKKDNVKLLKNKDLEKKREIENTLKNSFDKRSLVYLIKITNDDEIIHKFGYTDDIITRLRTHKNQIKEEIELVYCIESKDNKMLEKLLIDYLEQYKFRIKRVINNKQQTELLKVNDLQIIKNKLIELNNNVENDKQLIIELKNKIIDIQNENISLKLKLLKNNNEIINELENKIQVLEKIILNNKLDDNIKPFIENKDVVEDRIYKKKNVDKIDPTTLQILETYECINSIIIKNPEYSYSYNQLYRSIKNNNVYKDFRWNYSGGKINSTNKITIDINKIERIIQLDKNGNFVKMYSTKSELCKLLHIGIVKLNTYIEGKKIFKEFYYINESSYDKEIPDECNNYEIHNSKQIKEINIETNEIIMYKSMKELYEKRGISRETLRNCIKNNRTCDKYKWEYVNNNQNKNNSKKVKEINIKNKDIIIYDSMKKTYSKLNVTLEKLRSIINNKEIINDCKYEFLLD